MVEMLVDLLVERAKWSGMRVERAVKARCW